MVQSHRLSQNVDAVVYNPIMVSPSLSYTQVYSTFAACQVCTNAAWMLNADH